MVTKSMFQRVKTVCQQIFYFLSGIRCSFVFINYKNVVDIIEVIGEIKSCSKDRYIRIIKMYLLAISLYIADTIALKKVVSPHIGENP